MSGLSLNLSSASRWVSGFLFASALFVGGVQVHAAKSDLITVAAHAQRADPTLILTRGKADTIDIDGPISDIMVADPSILDVTVLQSNRLYVVGRALGNTNLIALDAEGNTIARMNIHVKVDELMLQDVLKDLFPKENVNVRTINDQIILSGEASSPMAASRISDVTGRFLQNASGLVNLMDVAGEQQVMLRVKIVEMSRSIVKELGIETNFNDPLETDPAVTIFDNLAPTSPDGTGFAVPGNKATAAQILGEGGITQTAAGIARFLHNTPFSAIGTVEVLLQALEDQNMASTLAEPNLTAISGEDAGFLVGGEFPVPDGIDDSGNTTFSYRPFGVTLNFTPRILSNDRINLQLETEISNRDDSNDAQIGGGINLPAFSVRRASTSIELPSGGSLMIAGLLDSETVNNMTGLPGVINTPIIGDLIKSKGFRRNETEVLVIVTAYLVKPYGDKDQVDHVPEPVNNALADAFAATIRRTYGDKADEFLDGDQRFGYLLD